LSFYLSLSIFESDWFIGVLHGWFRALRKRGQNSVMTCLRVQQWPCLAIPRALGKDAAFPGATPAAAAVGIPLGSQSGCWLYIYIIISIQIYYLFIVYI
jgi:hypothetical protein